MTTKQQPKSKRNTSAVWLNSDEFKKTKIIEPLGWDSEDWENDFYFLKITKHEFIGRLLKSKIEVEK